MKNNKIVLDTLGADMLPEEICEGLLLNGNSDYHYIIIGPKEKLASVLQKSKLSYEIISTDDFIRNAENPINIIKNRETSSLYIALNQVKQDDVIGLVTAGSTGAVMVGSMFILGLQPHLQSAVLACVLYNFDGKSFCLVDCGANVNPVEADMLTFANLGNEFMRSYGRVQNPKIGLLSIGKEKGKGNQLTKKAYTLLEESNLNFVGNIEADEVFTSDIDVLVSDGFSGNLLLKSTESLALQISSKIVDKVCLSNTDKEKINKEIYRLFAYNDQAGAILLGVNKPVIKVHGKANSQTIASGIKQLIDLHQGEIQRRR